MSKRSNFKRLVGDAYMTIDPKAVKPLLFFLEHKTMFIEPCAGACDLVDMLAEHGHICTHAMDIDPQDDRVNKGDALLIECPSPLPIITNPPWTRKVLHPMIEKFVTIAPEVWLLFDADWMHTKQAIPYLNKYCTDIVSVGRVKWIKDSKMSGKDNCAWYRFVEPSRKFVNTRFHNKEELK